MEGAAFHIDKPMAKNILVFKGSYVYVMLSSGEKLNGIVVDANDSKLHLAGLAGEELLDALVDMQSVAAVKAHFRKFDND